MTHDDAQSMDARRLRTRLAIRNVFFTMVLERRYYEIKIDDIVEQAGIARSTFYEHYKNKDELLASSLEGPFSILVGLIDDTTTKEALVHILEHFWQNRAMARGIFAGAVRKKVAATLANMIKQKIAGQGLNRKMPSAMIGIQISEMLLAPLGAWLTGQVACSSLELAEVLQKSVAGAVSGLKV